MADRIDDVTIVGGGDSGLLTGLLIQQVNPGIDVTVVDDFDQDPPQVGKSTFYKIYEILHGALDIDREEFTREVKPIWKCSVYFRDWCGCEPFHYPFDDANKFPEINTPDTAQVYASLHDEQYRNNLTVNEEVVEQGRSPWFVNPRSSEYQLYTPIAYHLDLDRFNGFLRGLCRERGISLLNDEIVDVEVSDGRVEGLRSKSQTYEADLYVDASGFNRVVQDELDGEFRDFGFPTDTAYNARFERPLSEVIPATVVESGESGWFWHIDTFENRDLGYVFASEYVSEEDALEEFLEFCEGVAEVPDDVTEDDVATFEFDSGYYRQPWAENCVVIGNAGGFVEPLESTGLTFNAEAAVRLANLLSARGRIADATTRETYNAWWQRCWESIYDFIAVHYKFAPGDTEFWEAMQAMAVSPRLERIVAEYDRNGFDTNVPAPTETGGEVEPLLIVRPENFYMLMRNMGRTSEFYESHEFQVSDELERGAEQARKQRAGHVEQNHVTTEQYYRGVLEL